MSKKKLSKQEQIIFFGEIAKRCTTDDQKIEFFDSYRDAFFTDSETKTLSGKEKTSKDLDDAFYVYANMKRLNEKELEKLKNHIWNEYSDIFKIFLFDFCILNGDAYSEYF